MSKLGNKKYRWYDEEDDGYYTKDGKRRNKSKEHDRRNAKRMKSALQSKNTEYFVNEDEEF